MLRQENVTIFTRWRDNGQVASRDYRVNGERHRDPKDGPAFESFWYSDGQVDYREYRVKGKLHRDPKEGPAWESFNEDGTVYDQEYWVNGEKVAPPCQPPDTIVVDGITYRRE